MKFRHRIKFTIDNISLHGKQVRAGIFMSFFAFLVLGVTAFIFKTTGQFRKDTQKAFAEDISGVGCIEISSDDEKKAMDFITECAHRLILQWQVLFLNMKFHKKTGMLSAPDNL